MAGVIRGDFCINSLVAHAPSPVPSCGSVSSDEHGEFLKPDLPILKPHVQLLESPLLNCLDFSLLNQLLTISPWSLLQLYQQNQPVQVPEVPSRKRPPPQSPQCEPQKKPKIRKLDDKVTASPVSGMFIKEESTLPPPEELQKEADQLDETAVYVEVSEESRRKIDEIENVIGDSVCCLCKVKYDDVFKLAQHKCPRIAHEEYKCPDCDKTFSCPANLASHRRWHRPRELDVMNCPKCSQPFTSKKLFKSHQHTCGRNAHLPLLPSLNLGSIVSH